MKNIIYISGASGSGKTTTTNYIQKKGLLDAEFCYFDSIGVPNIEEMNTQFGSGEKRQEVTTYNRTKYMLDSKSDTMVLDGQMRLSFITDAIKNFKVENYKIILIDCEDTIRIQRLVERGQANLGTEDMLNRAKYLRNEALHFGYSIIDNSSLSVEETAK